MCSEVHFWQIQSHHLRLLCDMCLQEFVNICYAWSRPTPSPLRKGHVFFFLFLMPFYRTAGYFLSFSSLLKVTTKSGRSAIITFLPTFAHTHFSFNLLVPVIVYIRTQWVSGMFTLCICCIFWWRHWCGWEQNFLLLTNKGWKQPALLIFLLNGVRRLKHCLLSTGSTILPTSLP